MTHFQLKYKIGGYQPVIFQFGFGEEEKMM